MPTGKPLVHLLLLSDPKLQNLCQYLIVSGQIKNTNINSAVLVKMKVISTSLSTVVVTIRVPMNNEGATPFIKGIHKTE